MCLSARGNRVFMEKRHPGLLRQIGGLAGLLVPAVGYSPRSNLGLDRMRKRIPRGVTTAVLPTPWVFVGQAGDKTNVTQLKPAWFVPAPGPTDRFSFNPAGI
jgi:hypothetical protein